MLIFYDTLDLSVIKIESSVQELCRYILVNDFLWFTSHDRKNSKPRLGKCPQIKHAVSAFFEQAHFEKIT